MRAMPPSSPDVSARMSRQTSRDTRAERAVRQLLLASGCRYRTHYPVPGIPKRKIDIAFTRAKLAVLVDGCF
jgi:DNA mismatch endonuclease (patch repair protein)